MLRSVVIAAGFLAGGTIAVSAEEIDFNRDVRPLLSDLCFQCHGPDRAARKGDLRLDRSEDAVRLLDSGRQPIVPGRPQASEVIRRLESSDPDEMMPPPKTGKRPTSEEIRTLRRWIAAGARYDTHWSFKP
ncbi:MAG: hypothetical protein KDM91_20850, partial [Verrucomicrobiae bacterium]|nr:hypothetical protein [Verrucomicrobiae bacterium]